MTPKHALGQCWCLWLELRKVVGTALSRLSGRLQRPYKSTLKSAAQTGAGSFNLGIKLSCFNSAFNSLQRLD
jgi:hypothetical protein